MIFSDMTGELILQTLMIIFSGLTFFFIRKGFYSTVEEFPPQVGTTSEGENCKIIRIREIISREGFNNRSNPLEEIRKVVSE